MSRFNSESKSLIRIPLSVAMGACLIASAPALGAQPNRVLDAIAAVPSQQPGAYDIHVQWHVEAGDSAQTQNLSTSVAIAVNGAVIATLPQSVGVEKLNACGGFPCGDGPCALVTTNVIEPMYCVYDGQENTCDCVSGTFVSVVPAIVLAPGDTLSASLLAMEGALPDPPQDNAKSYEMGEGALGWNRALLDAQIVNNDQDEPVLRLDIAFTSAVADVNTLDFGVGVQAGGNTIGLAGAFTVQVIPFDGCSFDCEPDGCPEPQSDPGEGGHWETFCSSSGFGSFPWYTHCNCMNIYIIEIEFDQLEFIDPGFGFTDWGDILDYGDLLPPSVVLLPAPGAASELITADDTITIEASEPPATCPEDVNEDGAVNSIDLNAILAQFGLSCG